MKRILAALLITLPAGAAELPVRAITLSNAGLMQVERAGRLEAWETATLTIPTAQVDDVLKSLLVRDPLGTVLGVSLPAQNFTEEAFRGLPLRPEDFATRLTMFSALRGQSVALGGAEGLLVDVTEGEAGLLVIILGERGLTQVTLREGDALRLNDAALAARVARAAAALAASRTAETRRAEIRFSADATREVALAYVTAAPLWKASFRLVMGDGGGRMQGWAVVENRSGADWEEVRLALVSGNPVAYAQALYTPILRARPVLPVRGAEVVTPQADRAPQPVMAPPAMAVMGRGAMAAPAPAPAPAPAQAPAPPPPPPAPLAQAVAESSAGSVAFTLPSPVSLRASETANLPFLDAALPTEQLWWVQGTGARHPLNTARIRNTTGSTLPDGLVAVWAGPAFVGDAELRALNDGETRLLAYAQDRDVAISFSRTQNTRTTRISTARGVVVVEGEEELVWSMALAPRGGHGVVVVDMPRIAGWTQHFAVAAEGDFGLRHEARLEGRDVTWRFPYLRPARVETPVWDPGLGSPAVLGWRGLNIDIDSRRLPGGLGTLERLSELLARVAPETPGRPALAGLVTGMAELRRLLDLATGAIRESVAAEAALARARTAADAWGGGRAVRLMLAVQVGAMACLLAPWDWLLWPGAVAAGFAAVGITAVLLALLRQTHGAASPALWARGTAGYAAAQAASAFLLAGVFAASGEMHAAIFALGLLASAAALAAVMR